MSQVRIRMLVRRDSDGMGMGWWSRMDTNVEAHVRPSVT